VKYYVLLILLITFILSIFPSPKATATSDSILILQVQTSSATSASDEIIVLVNTSEVEINITDWCIHYSSSSDVTKRKLACVQSQSENINLYLEPKGLISFSSGEFVLSNPGFVPDLVFTSGMANSSGHVWLTDADGVTVDRLGWGSAVNPESVPALGHNLNESISRNYFDAIIDTDNNQVDYKSLPVINPLVSGLFEKEIIIDRCSNLEEVQVEIPNGYLLDEDGICQKDECNNIEGLQTFVPAGYQKDLSSVECQLVPLENSILFITELLPNAPSVDTGNEFIEIYNPNSKSVNLKGYVLQVGPAFTKQYELNEGLILPGEYLIFSDTESKIVLPNTSGVQLRLLAPNGEIVSQSPVYTNASDDVSWALVEDQWIYTNQITPSSGNKPYLEISVDEVLGVTTVLAPCPVGKFRNPETNRCKNIETAISALQPCDEDEFRNPETNRCRKIQTLASLSSCPEGQERNPETNRCRKVSVLSSSSEDVAIITDVEVQNTSGKINWPVIILALLGTFGYMAYEWRNEIRKNFSRLKTKLVQ
jgi:hypothetical protein